MQTVQQVSIVLLSISTHHNVPKQPALKKQNALIVQHHQRAAGVLPLVRVLLVRPAALQSGRVRQVLGPIILCLAQTRMHVQHRAIAIPVAVDPDVAGVARQDLANEERALERPMVHVRGLTGNGFHPVALTLAQLLLLVQRAQITRHLQVVGGAKVRRAVSGDSLLPGLLLALVQTGLGFPASVRLFQ